MNRDYLNKLASALWKDLCYWTREIRRLWGPLLTVALMIYWRKELLEADPYSDLAKMVWKIVVMTIPILAWHMWRSQIFPYLNFGQWIRFALVAVRRGLNLGQDDKERHGQEDEAQSPEDLLQNSMQFLGACLVIGLVSLAGAVLIGSLAIAILIAFSMGL